MSANGVYIAAEPFADAGAGFAYFGTDHHYRHLVERICGHFAERAGIVVVTGEPRPDGELMTRYLDAGGENGYRATLVRCRQGMQFDDVVKLCNRQLELESEEDGGGLWSLLSHLMLEARKGITRIVVIDMADSLDDRGLDELYRFAKLDEPNLVPIVLLASPSFLDRLDSPALQFLAPAIVARLALQRLEPPEVAAFIHYQLNATMPEEGASLPPDTIAAIATAAQGDPGAVNRLARTALAGRRAARARPAARPARPPANRTEGHGDGKDAAGGPMTLNGHTAPAQEPTKPIMPSPASAVPTFAVLPAREARKPAVPPPAPAPISGPAPASISGPAAASAPEPLRLAAPTILALPSAEDEDEDGEEENRSEGEQATPPRRRLTLQQFTPLAYVLIAIVSGGAVLSLFTVSQLRPAKLPAAAEASLVPRASAPVAAAPSIDPPAPVETAAAAPPPPPPPPAIAPLPAPASAAASMAAEPAPAAPAVADQAAAEPATAEPMPLAAAESVPSPAPAPLPDARTAAAAAAIAPSAAPPERPATASTPGAARARVAMAEPVVPSAAEPPAAVDPIPPTDFAVLVRRGDQLLMAGDIISARSFFERAAESGDALALCGLGKSYDPLFLRQVGTRGVPPDPAKAADWYRKAAGAGSIEASVRLERLLASYPQ